MLCFTMILVTVVLTGNVMASFATGHLIRVVYDTVGTKEYATDLGPMASFATASNMQIGGGADAVTTTILGAASWNSLVVGYFLVDATSGANQVAVAGAVGGLQSGNRKFTSYNGAAGQVIAMYNLLAPGSTSLLIADKTVGNTYFSRMDSAGSDTGSYGGWLPAGSNPGGSLSLAAISTTGYVDQSIYTWGPANLGLQGPTSGIVAFTVRTMANGSTVINPLTATDTTSPVVTSFTMPATATTTAVAVTSFTATDNVAVTGYLITENATIPLLSDSGWSASAPTLFTFSGAGTRTAYAWAKDGAGNISSPVTATTSFSKPVKVVSPAGIFTSDLFQDGYNLASEGATLFAKSMHFSEKLVVNQPISVTLRGGYNADFTSQIGFSTLNGLTVSKGSVIIDRIALQ